jgi:hypothetical protein
MPGKRGDRARQTAEQRARREWRQLTREEKLREDHVRPVAERSQDPRFYLAIHRHDGSTVYRWPADSLQHDQFRELMESQAQLFRDKFGRDLRPEDPILFDSDADEPRPRELDTVSREMIDGLRRDGRESRARSHAHRGVVRVGLRGDRG